MIEKIKEGTETFYIKRGYPPNAIKVSEDILERLKTEFPNSDSRIAAIETELTGLWVIVVPDKKEYIELCYL